MPTRASMWEEDAVPSVSSLITQATRSHESLSSTVLRSVPDPERLRSSMKERWHVMMEAVDSGWHGTLRSAGGMVAGDGRRYLAYLESGQPLMLGVLGRALGYALAVSECNACMGRICAAPTAGSCGIIPGVYRSLQEEYQLDEAAVIGALITAGAIGRVIAHRASLAGAEGGCQAECGSASAMAAAGAVELTGGSPEQAGHAAALAIKSFMGLACDPVGGLVEVPCIKRNGIAAVHALAAADMARAGIESVIPVDEVIDAMGAVGPSLPLALRETGEGGVAATPTAERIVAAMQAASSDSSERRL